MNKTWIAAGVMAIALGIGGLGLFASHTAHTEEAPAVVKPLDKTTVDVAQSAMGNLHLLKVETTAYPDQIDVTGKVSVTENGTTVISARGAGRIETVQVASGEPVEQGQLVAKIYSPDFAAAREELLQAAKRKGSNDNDFSQLRTMSIRKLESLGLSKDDIKKLGSSDPNLLAVHAPASGIIIDKKAVLGGAVNVGDPLFTIGDMHKVWFLGDLYPEDLPKVHEGQDVVIDPPVEGGAPIQGKVSFISPILDPGTRTIKIRMLMDNPNLALRGDMYVQAHVILSKRDVIVVPATSVFNEDGEEYVFLQSKDKPSIFEKKEVKISGQQSDKVVIQSGVEAGDTIVSDGGLLLDAALNGDSAP